LQRTFEAQSLTEGDIILRPCSRMVAKIVGISVGMVRKSQKYTNNFK
jgi:hypothetical protein